MDKKTKGIVAYITIIGWIIALIKNSPKDEYVSFHIRQMLGVAIFSILVSIIFSFIAGILDSSIIQLIGSIVGVVFWVIGLMGALSEQKKLVPVIGELSQKLFKSL